MHFLTDRTAHIAAFDGPILDHWMGWKIAPTANASNRFDDPYLKDKLGVLPPELHSIP